MNNNRQQSKLKEFISNLMQGSTEDERIEAEERFTEYLKLVRDIQRRKAFEKNNDLDSGTGVDHDNTISN